MESSNSSYLNSASRSRINSVDVKEGSSRSRSRSKSTSSSPKKQEIPPTPKSKLMSRSKKNKLSLEQKNNILKRFQELDEFIDDDNDEYSELDKNLTSSKFSGISGISFIADDSANGSSPFVNDIKRRLSDIRIHEENKLNESKLKKIQRNKSFLAGSTNMKQFKKRSSGNFFPPDYTFSSHSNSDSNSILIEMEQSTKADSQFSDSPILLNAAQILKKSPSIASDISPTMKFEKSKVNENIEDSPFLEISQEKINNFKSDDAWEKKLISKTSSNQEISRPRLKSRNQSLKESSTPNLAHIENTPDHTPLKEYVRPSSNISTPIQTPKKLKRADKDISPVKMRNQLVSLTPAQRIEKKTGKFSNALDNFQFVELLGKGAFAHVFKGVNLKTGHIVAIKQIEIGSNDVTELMSEIDLLKILKHPNIVKYHGFVKTNVNLNIFLEFCSGGSLRSLYKSLGSGLSEERVIPYVKQILHGLNYLHEQGVVHRDVKAANVLLTSSGDVKLADFGVATKVSTRDDLAVGTPNWMAPETVLGGEGVCTASDIWSLGATIIELLTMNPPYHNLNPMAALHAIGTDDYPPLPTNISPLAKDFLLECFQKQSTIRSTAKRLLKHRWLSQNTNVLKQSSHFNIPRENNMINDFKENFRMNNENWENEADPSYRSRTLAQKNASKFFGVSEIQLSPHQLSSKGKSDNDRATRPNIEMNPFNDEEDSFIEKFSNYSMGEIKNNVDAINMFNPVDAGTKTQILRKYSDVNDSFNEFEIDNVDEDNRFNFQAQQIEDEFSDEEDDPFLDLAIENVDTSEIKINAVMELLVEEFSANVDNLYNINDKLVSELIDYTSKMLHLLDKYPFTKSIIIREHGLLSFLELLEIAAQYPEFEELWLNSLQILNLIFKDSADTLENFCILGGIPIFTHFSSLRYKTEIRLKVVDFVQYIVYSDKSLSMFVSCGGLRLLSKFIEEDLETLPQFPLVSIDCIYHILMRDLIRSRSDLCRILSRYGVVFWLVVILNDLMNLHNQEKNHNGIDVEVNVNKILQILSCFGRAEPRVRINISSTDFFKLLLKVYVKLNFNQQIIILKFFRSVSTVSTTLDILYSANILEFLLNLLKEFTPAVEGYKEITNVVCPILYNLCYLNHSREIEIVKLGSVPLLKSLSMINLPFRQFTLPILCELVNCDKSVRTTLWENGILKVYLNLLSDPYWQSNALDSVVRWYQQENEPVEAQIVDNFEDLIKGFLVPRPSNLESTLENFMKLLNSSRICVRLFDSLIINNLLTKLRTYNKNSVIQLGLLRILKSLIIAQNYSEQSKQLAVVIKDSLAKLSFAYSSILVNELKKEIISLLSENRNQNLDDAPPILFFSPNFARVQNNRLGNILND